MMHRCVTMICGAKITKGSIVLQHGGQLGPTCKHVLLWNFHFPTTMEPKVCFCQEHARQLEVLIVATMKAALSIHVTVQKKKKKKRKKVTAGLMC